MDHETPSWIVRRLMGAFLVTACATLESALESITLKTFEPYEAHDEVTVDATYMDSAWAVSGVITVRNPTPCPATVSAVVEALAGAPNLTLECPWMVAPIPAGGTVTRTYSADLSDGTARVDTVSGVYVIEETETAAVASPSCRTEPA